MSNLWRSMVGKSALVCGLLMMTAAPALSVTAESQTALVRQLFQSRPETWVSLLAAHKEELNDSFFQRIRERIEWSQGQGLYTDAERFATLENAAYQALGRGPAADQQKQIADVVQRSHGRDEQVLSLVRSTLSLGSPERIAVLQMHREFLDQSFFAKVSERIRFALTNGCIEDARRFAELGDDACKAMDRSGEYLVEFSEAVRRHRL